MPIIIYGKPGEAMPQNLKTVIPKLYYPESKRIQIVLLILFLLFYSPGGAELIKGFFSIITTIISVYGKPPEKFDRPAEKSPELSGQNEFDHNDDTETQFFFAKAYEALGDQCVVNNDFSGAIEQYTHAIQNLEKAIYEQDQFFNEINEVKDLISVMESKKENCNYVVEFFTKYSLEDKNSTNSDYLFDLEVIARNWADLKMWKNAVIWNYCLFNQETTGSRRERIIQDLQYTLNMWQSSDDFKHDISSQSVIAVVNETNVNFRREPVLEDNVIRQFELFEKVHVLQRSDFRQSIEGVNAHWYKICTDDGHEGWIFGEYLMFFPSISSQSIIAVVNDTNVNFRREPVLKNNIIKQFTIYEKVHVLQRSDSRQSIEGVNAYWYKVYSDDGVEGWIYGQYLLFFP